jgi:hypothetical protein
MRQSSFGLVASHGLPTREEVKARRQGVREPMLFNDLKIADWDAR